MTANRDTDAHDHKISSDQTTEEPNGGVDETPRETESDVDGLVAAKVRPHEIETVRVRRQSEGPVVLSAVSTESGGVVAQLVLCESGVYDLARDLERAVED